MFVAPFTVNPYHFQCNYLKDKMHNCRRPASYHKSVPNVFISGVLDYVLQCNYCVICSPHKSILNEHVNLIIMKNCLKVINVD